MPLFPQPLPLETLMGRVVWLRPMELSDVDGLIAAATPGELWKSWLTTIPRPDETAAYVEAALRERAAGTAHPFVIVEQSSQRIVGTTRYAAIRRAHRCVEIGWTWLAEAWQRTGVNTEAKYLLLHYAFETLGCVRVELKTDVLNERSRRAIERIGAKPEGILRQHMIMPNGRIRDTIYYSIIASEWPEVKARLEEKIRLGEKM
jgi:RimJ/RimL family protein N-acetyltransferase